MRPIRFLIALLCLALGIAVGVLNAAPVSVNLGFSVLHATLGVVILVSLLAGVILGGLALTASVILPLRRRMHRDRALAQAQARASSVADNITGGH